MRFERFPFFTGVLEKRNDTPFPLSFPFEIAFDSQLSIYRQKMSDELNQLLSDVYTDGSMLNGALDGDEGAFQANAAIRFIDKCTSIENNELLEIGCGNGYILKQLNKKGAKCTGIEPGPQVFELEESKTIKFVHDFFPSDQLEGMYDLIVHFNVLEHLDQPIKIILDQKRFLKKGGRLIIGVPNAEPYLANGDISLFVHEHCNYFTKEGFLQLAHTTEMTVEKLEDGANGGMLFASFINEFSASSIEQTYSPFNHISFEEETNLFHQRISKVIDRNGQEDTAIYCPLRAINSLSHLGLSKCRLVDDKPSLKGRYLPGFDHAIESFDDLLTNQPKCIIIFSRTFADKIKSKCENEIALNKVKLLTLEDIDKEII